MNAVNSIKNYFKTHKNAQLFIVISLGVVCLTPIISAPLALLMGFLAAEFVGNPFEASAKSLTTLLLQFSVVGLGFGMNVDDALKTGKEGFEFTVISIISVLSLVFF